jgi:hypothetical protein
MGLKLFSTGKVITYNTGSFTNSDTSRDITIKDNTQAIGYKPDESIPPVAPGSPAMHIFSTEDKVCRQVDGQVYSKPKPHG